MKFFENKKKKNGFSLLEVVLAIAIFSFSSFSIATLLIDSGISTRLAADKEQSIFYANEGLDALSMIENDLAWTDLTAGPHGLLQDELGWTFSGTSDLIDDRYTRTVNITDISTSVKDVIISIEWALTENRNASINLETMITNWGNN